MEKGGKEGERGELEGGGIEKGGRRNRKGAGGGIGKGRKEDVSGKEGIKREEKREGDRESGIREGG